MSFLTSAALFVGAYWFPITCIAICIRLICNHFKPGISEIPGPFLASLSDIWLLIHCIRRKSIEDHKLHAKYKSPLIRLGPNTIAVSDAQAVKTIYGWNPVFKKSRLYLSQYVTTENGTVLENMSSTMDETVHSRLRRPVAHAYSLSTLVEFEPLVDSTSLVFFKQIEERFVEKGLECPLSKWVQMYAFDIIGELTFSKRFGFIESGSDLDNMMYHTGRAMDYIGIMGQIPTVDEYVRLKGFGHILRRFRPTGPLMKFTGKQIRSHTVAYDGSRPDFLTRFIKAKEKYPDIVTDGRLATYANTNVSAGSDTTAIALREIIYRILVHDQCYAKVIYELKNILGARPSDGGYTKPITWAESQKMTYFQAVVKECLRIHPALGQTIPRDVPKGGVELCGRFIPEGTVVGCNAWTVNRDENVYGPNTDQFVPERWLDSDSERVRNMENLNFTFGGGPRVCLGKNIAMLEISKFVPELFRRFEITLVDPKRYKLRPGWLVLQNGLDVTLTKRAPSSLRT